MASYSRRKKIIIGAVIITIVILGVIFYVFQNQLPEIYFTNITWKPDIIRKGTNIEFTFTLKNRGFLDKATEVDVYLQRFSCFSGSCREKIGEVDVTAKAGSDTTVNFKYMFKKEGFYYIIFDTGYSTLKQLVYVSPGRSTKNEFRFAVFGDNRPPDSVSPQPAVFREIINEVNYIRPDFAVLVGDIIYGYRSDLARLKWQWSDFLSVYQSSQVPIFVAPGNHEMQTEELPESGNPDAQALYVMNLGRLYYAFEYGNSLFVILDTDIVGEASEISGKQLQWFENLLKEHRDEYQHVFVFFHKPVISYEGADMLNNHDEILPILLKYRVTAVFQGHNHAYYYERVNGTDFYVTGGAGAPLYLRPSSGGLHHYLLVTVKGSSYHVQFLPVPSLRFQYSSNQVVVEYLFEKSLHFKRYDYSWSAEPEPLLLKGICRSNFIKTQQRRTVNFGTINGCLEVIVKPGEKKTINLPG